MTAPHPLTALYPEIRAPLAARATGERRGRPGSIPELRTVTGEQGVL